MAAISVGNSIHKQCKIGTHYQSCSSCAPGTTKAAVMCPDLIGWYPVSAVVCPHLIGWYPVSAVVCPHLIGWCPVSAVVCPHLIGWCPVSAVVDLCHCTTHLKLLHLCICSFLFDCTSLNKCLFVNVCSLWSYVNFIMYNLYLLLLSFHLALSSVSVYLFCT